MLTSYLNNVQCHLGNKIRSIVNVISDQRDSIRIARRPGSSPNEKHVARAHLSDIASFKDIISNAESFAEIMTRTDEIDDLGNEFQELFAMLSPVLEATARPGGYAKGSLWYDIKANPEKHVSTICELAELNESLPQLLGIQGIRFQPIPLRHSFIPSFVPFDTGVVGAHILGLSRRANTEIVKKPRRILGNTL